MKAEMINEKQDQAWDQMVQGHPFGCVFQTSGFKRVIAETFPQTKPCYLALTDEEGTIRGGVPLFLVRSWLTGTRLVSLPFVLYSDPLVRSAEEFALLFERILELYAREKASYLEIKARDSTALLGGIEQMTPVLHHRTHRIDLTHGLDYVWKHLRKTAVQQRIRRSEREGIVVRSAAGEQEVMVFYRMLVQTRKRLGVPPQNYGFFERIWKYLKPLGMADFLVAWRKDQAIGGASIFVFKDTLYVGHTASKQEYWPLGINQALFWRALQVAVDHSCTVYDIGKTSCFDEGLLTYKRQWGAQELETPCFYYPCFKGVSSLNDERKLSYQIMTLMWRKLPDPVLRSAARFVYRHLG